MKKLSKEQLKTKSNLVADLQNAAEEILSALDGLNSQIVDYNSLIDDARSLRDEITSEIEAYVQERSEKWSEGEKGQAYEAWKDEWENLDLEYIDEVGLEDPGVYDQLDEAPNAPDC